MEAFLTVEDVAERLRIHPQTVRGWIRTGRLSAVRAGRLLRVSPVALEHFLSPAASPPVCDPRADREAIAALAAKYGLYV